MGRSPMSVQKRRREQALRERKQLKAEKRVQRKTEKTGEFEQETPLEAPAE